MRTHWRPFLLVLPLVLVPLAACGEEAGPEQESAGRAELESRAAALQVPLEHTYVTEVPGFELAEQSVGVVGDDGFGSTYVHPVSGAAITLTVNDGTVDEATCGCVAEGDAWYRGPQAGDHAWLRAQDGLVISVSSSPGQADKETLRTALDEARPATDAELSGILPPIDPGLPVERGDLPDTGDGAPLDPEGASG